MDIIFPYSVESEYFKAYANCMSFVQQVRSSIYVTFIFHDFKAETSVTIGNI